MDIFASQKYIWRLDELNSTYQSYFLKEKQLFTKRQFFIGLTAIVLVLVLRILVGNTSDDAASTIIYALIYILTLPATIIAALIYNSMQKRARTRAPTQKEIAATRRKHGKEIEAIEKEMRELDEVLQQSELPSQYHYPFAVDWMINAITTKRADTLKEAINLYENYLQSERHNQNIVDAVNNIQITYYYH
mgnify:CR=1 FL=1